MHDAGDYFGRPGCIEETVYSRAIGSVQRMDGHVSSVRQLTHRPPGIAKSRRRRLPAHGPPHQCRRYSTQRAKFWPDVALDVSNALVEYPTYASLTRTQDTIRRLPSDGS